MSSTLASAAEARPTVDVRAMPRVLRRILGLALRHRGPLVLALTCAFFSALAALTLPRLFGHAVDQAQRLLSAGAAHAGEAQAALWHTALLVICATAVRGVLTGLSGYLGESVSQKVAYDLRLAFFDKLQRLSFGFHDRIHSGDLITRGMIDMEGARMFIQGGLMLSVSLVLMLGVSTVMMFVTDWRMALLGLAFVPIAAFLLGRLGILLRITWMRMQRMMGVLTLTIEENLQGVRVVRAFAATDHELARFDGAADAVLAIAYRRIVLRVRAVTAMNVSFWTSMGLLLWYGGHQVIAGRMTVGRLTEFLTYMTLLQAPIRQIAMIVASSARATVSGGRLFEILDQLPEVVDRPGAQPLVLREGVLRFEHVDFAYEPGKPVLHDISFEVGPGRTLGIVGAPGSGKSTIANLIPRFYDVTAGRVTLDGQDVRDVTLASLRQHVGLVQQETFLFDTSVVNNVAYADPWAEDARILSAARTAQIHEHVVRMPQGYETRIGERGVALSGGQRQRLSIARGVTPEPGVMIFDDSTAAIDAVTEQKVRDGLAEATQAKATVIIAHRLSSLMHADEILVLDEGRVVERGDHAALVALGGVYAQLYALQTRSEVLDEDAIPAETEA